MTQGPIDFSSLDPSRDDARWEQRVAETVEQAGLVAELDLASLQPFGSGDAERDAVRRILETPDEPPVLRLAPRALAVAAALAAAAWLLVWFDAAPPATQGDAALAAMSWASSGESLSVDQMSAVTGGIGHGD